MTDDRFTVFSPIGGIVIHLAALEGDYVQTGSPVAEVADLGRLWLEMEAYESQLPLLRWGQRVTFTVEAHPGERFEGRVSFIDPVVDEHTRTAGVRAAIDNADRRLKPGMFATAVVRTRVSARGSVPSDELAGKWVGPMHPEIVKDEPGTCDICGMDLVRAEDLGVVGDPASHEEPLVVPRSAVLLTGARAVVYVRVPDAEQPTFEGREVVLGPRAGAFYVVREGLAEGEEVVTNGAFKLDSAMQISAKPSMMMPAGGGSAGHAHHGQEAPPARPRVGAVPEGFVATLTPIYAAYLDAQEALADDDLDAYNAAVDALARAAAVVGTAGLLGEPLDVWRRAAAPLASAGRRTDIEDARADFEKLSSAALRLQKRFGHAGVETWHEVFCPMAFDNQGAAWLQRGDVVDNPYFGETMLRCGTIRATFPPAGGHDHE